MDHSIRSTILRATEVVWRRRFLLALPFLIMLPVSFGGAYLFAGGYAARSLVMLQETAASNPLAHDVSEPNADRMAQTLKGLRALLSSDYVLAPIVDEASGGSLDPTSRARQINDLARHVSVDLLGNDFLEFRLTGKSPYGLGATLQKIMTNLIDALVARPGESAGNFALKTLEQSAAAKEQQSLAIDERMTRLLPDGLAVSEGRLSNWAHQKEALAGKLRLSETMDKVSPDSMSPNSSIKRGVSPMLAQTNAHAKYKNEILGWDSKISALESRISAFKEAQIEKNDLVVKQAEIRAKLEAYRSRSADQAAVNWSTIVNAPEHMIIVDPPKDPKIGSSSRVTFILSGIFGGLLLGVVLVIVAEIFDTTIRTPEQMVAIAGVPCLGSLPTLLPPKGASNPIFPFYARRPRLPAGRKALLGRRSEHNG